MRAHQIMTRSVITITPDATILEAANTMLQHHVSGLPVVDAAGNWSGSSRRAISFAAARSARSASAAAGSNSCLAPAQPQPITFMSMAARSQKS